MRKNDFIIHLEKQIDFRESEGDKNHISVSHFL